MPFHELVDCDHQSMSKRVSSSSSITTESEETEQLMSMRRGIDVLPSSAPLAAKDWVPIRESNPRFVQEVGVDHLASSGKSSGSCGSGSRISCLTLSTSMPKTVINVADHATFCA